MGSSVLNEEQQLHRRSQALWDHLLQTEHRAQELAQETQRLKRIKDEAKALVMNKHPDLFPASQDYMGGGGGFGDPLSDDSQTSYMTQDLREIRNLLNHK